MLESVLIFAWFHYMSNLTPTHSIVISALWITTSGLIMKKTSASCIILLIMAYFKVFLDLQCRIK